MCRGSYVGLYLYAAMAWEAVECNGRIGRIRRDGWPRIACEAEIDLADATREQPSISQQHPCPHSSPCQSTQ
ncbi:hypothetical protein EJ03DRAFT_324619 [Teratosphaeria nubilosa]|uniref:Uncharacterized protein n=1 Tax=Teratosphaeria nubilosa TaxID=161662 RepID=A0A6G1LI27_9PEZI|nr:hypothetical protein EJ03DRAFT_324619 [Teratosphaeria nubilosa]